jgi:hypothetical protein
VGAADPPLSLLATVRTGIAHSHERLIALSRFCSRELWWFVSENNAYWVLRLSAMRRIRKRHSAQPGQGRHCLRVEKREDPNGRPITGGLHLQKVTELFRKGLSKRVIAKQIGISRTSLRRLLAPGGKSHIKH